MPGPAYRVDRKQIGQAIQKHRERAGLTQQELGQRLGLHKQTITKYEAGDISVSAARLGEIAEILGINTFMLLRTGSDSEPMAVGESPPPEEKWYPSEALSRELPSRAYEVALGYLRRLERAGVPTEQIEDAERLMLDNRYAKLNKRERAEPTEADWIDLIDATWEIIREVLSWQGIRP